MKVADILKEELCKEKEGESSMTKKELLELEGVQELIAEAREEVEAKLREANLRADTAEKVLRDSKLVEYKDRKIEELDKPEEVKKLLRDRVSIEGDEPEIDRAIADELAYIDKVVSVSSKE